MPVWNPIRQRHVRGNSEKTWRLGGIKTWYVTAIGMRVWKTAEGHDKRVLSEHTQLVRLLPSCRDAGLCFNYYLDDNNKLLSSFTGRFWCPKKKGHGKAITAIGLWYGMVQCLAFRWSILTRRTNRKRNLFLPPILDQFGYKS